MQSARVGRYSVNFVSHWFDSSGIPTLEPPTNSVCLLLLYTIENVFQLYHGGDMTYEMMRRKHELILLSTQGVFNLPYHIGMV